MLLMKNWKIAGLIFVIALLPRVIDLGIFLTADEKNWLSRSYEFIRAFKDWRFNDMLQTTHPGVTVLWTVGAAVTAKMIGSNIPFSIDNLRHFVAAAQWPVAGLNAIAIVAIYWLLQRLFNNRWLAGLATLFMALNPFLIGYARVAHVDALLGSLMFLAALATLLYVKEKRAERWLVGSGILTGLAILTKIPGIFLLPFFILTALVYRRWRLRDLVLWGLIVGVVIVVLWPALLWVPDPQGNVLLVKRDVGQAALTPHHMADTYSVEAWHYPAALLTRTTPIVLVLSVGAVLILAWRARFREDRRVEWLLVAYVLFFVLMMTLGAKKGDRYVLPVFFALDTLAAWVVVQIGIKWRRLAVGLGAASVIYLGGLAVYNHPYAIAYSSPWWPDNLSQELGWGEGLEQVGAWLSKNDPQAVVASWYPEELQAYTSARVAHLNTHEQPNIDYVVLYRNMFGRAPDHPANDFIDEYFKKREPVFVAKALGKEFAWVYLRTKATEE
jgi:hypothetical protein